MIGNGLSFSSYGSRVDLQGWGESVMTTGYGSFYSDPDDPTNQDRWYRSTFSGTSSASPFIAGAVANIQGIVMNDLGAPLTAEEVLALLVDTGSPQLGDLSENIGPRPDLRQAIDQLIANTPPVAGFSFNISGLSVAFTDTSSDSDGTLTNWAWDFGDSNTSSTQTLTIAIRQRVLIV